MPSADPTEHQHRAEEIWRTYMTTGDMPAYLGVPWYMKRFMRPIARFYQATSKVLYSKNALLEKLIGDEVTGFFVPGIAGPDHARVAIEAGEEILRVTGHADPRGPWVPVGVGVHTGLAFVGAVGSADSAPEISVLGDTVNTAARIASQAKAGELLFSAAAGTAARLPPQAWKRAI